jgi:hypothetical protein
VWQAQVVIVIGALIEAVADVLFIGECAVGFVGVVFHGLEAELLGGGSAGNEFPGAAEGGVVLRIFANLGDNLGILRTCGGSLHGFHPLLGLFCAVAEAVDTFGDGFDGFLRLNVDFFFNFSVCGSFKCLGQRLAAQGLILLKLVARHEQVRAHGIEAPYSSVRGQLVDVDFDAEQFAEGVFVLAAIESAHGNGAVLVCKVTAGGDHQIGKVIEKICLLRFGRLFFVLGRHFA